MRDAERVWADAAGLARSDLIAAQPRADIWGIRALRNPPPNDQPFLGRLRALAGFDIAPSFPYTNDIGSRETGFARPRG